LASAVGSGMQTTATAWLALDSAGGAFAVGLVLAARMLPSLLFGLAAGTVADRARRTHVLVGVGLAALPIMLGLNRLAGLEVVPAGLLAALSFAYGCLPVFDIPARQALVMDTVPRDLAPNAMALNATATRLCNALGAFVAGALIPGVGVPGVYLGVAVASCVAAGLVLGVRPQGSVEGRPWRTRVSFGRALGEAARMIVDLPAVRTLMLAGIACEVFGFSFATAVPVLARDVLQAGAEGLGTLNAAAAIGGMLAVASLSLLPGHLPRQPLLGGVFVVYGLALLALARSGELALAAAALLVIGACAAAFDVLQQTLLQLSVPEDQRGRAVGIWVLGVGSAPVGYLEMGALIDRLGAPAGLLINGLLTLVAAAALLSRAPVYRWGLRQKAQPPA
jgi:predicted MFS family arabinose efflux permease